MRAAQIRIRGCFFVLVMILAIVSILSGCGGEVELFGMGAAFDGGAYQVATIRTGEEYSQGSIYRVTPAESTTVLEREQIRTNFSYQDEYQDNSVEAIAAAPDGSVLYVVTNTFIGIYSSTDSIKHQFEDYYYQAEIAVSPEGKYCAVAVWRTGSNVTRTKEIYLFDQEGQQLLHKQLECDGSIGLSVNDRGDVLVAMPSSGESNGSLLGISKEGSHTFELDFYHDLELPVIDRTGFIVYQHDKQRVVASFDVPEQRWIVAVYDLRSDSTRKLEFDHPAQVELLQDDTLISLTKEDMYQPKAVLTKTDLNGNILWQKDYQLQTYKPQLAVSPDRRLFAIENIWFGGGFKLEGAIEVYNLNGDLVEEYPLDDGVPVYRDKSLNASLECSVANDGGVWYGIYYARK